MPPRTYRSTVALAAALTTSTGVLFWSADSRIIYYPDGSGIVALEVDGSGETLVLGERRQHLPLRNGDILKALHPDGRRFLVEHLAEIDAGGESGVVTVVTGFHEMLLRRGVMGEPR